MKERVTLTVNDHTLLAQLNPEHPPVNDEAASKQKPLSSQLF